MQDINSMTLNEFEHELKYFERKNRQQTGKFQPGLNETSKRMIREAKNGG